MHDREPCFNCEGSGYVPATLPDGPFTRALRAVCPDCNGTRSFPTSMEVIRRLHPPPAFECPACGRKSWNPGDGQHRFCGACNRFFP